jgi:FkbM family methyltransferase
MSRAPRQRDLFPRRVSMSSTIRTLTRSRRILATLVACCYVIIRVFFRESKPFEVRKPLGIRDVGSDFSGELLVSIENAEHRLVQKFIQPGDVVLEFGGRFGTTSCEIAKRLNNSGKLAVVEPDFSVWDILRRNLKVNNCKAQLVLGTLSSVKLFFSAEAYATRTMVNPNSSEYYAISHENHVGKNHDVRQYSYAEVENLLQASINTILIDCEGCLSYMFEHIKGAVENKQIHTVIFEADMPKVGGRKNITGTDCRSECVDYDVFVDFLLSNDFRELASFNDCDLSRSGIPSGDWCGSWIWHYAFQRVF